MDIVVAEKLAALINLSDIHIQKLYFQVTKKTFNKNLRTLLFWKTVKLSTWKKKVKSSILIKWTWKLLVETPLKTLKLVLELKKLKKWMMKKSRLLVFLLIKRTSQIGKMVKMIYFMKSIHSILSILCHLRVNLIINRTSTKNNKKNWKSITKCCRLSDKVQMPWSAWVNINLQSSILKLQIKKLSNLSKCRLDLKFKLKSLKLFGLRPYQVILIHLTKKNLSSITIKLVSWI